MVRISTLVLSMLATAWLTSGSALANPRPLAFTYPVSTLAEGELELEQYIDIIPVEVAEEGGGQHLGLRFELQSEFEIALSDRWELGFYLVGAQPADGQFAFRGIKQRIRGRFADEGEWPVDVGVYFELIEKTDEFELEQKILLGKRLGDLLLLGNISFEQAWHFGEDEVELVYNPSFGASYAITPSFNVGLEMWMKGEFGGDEGPEVYAGPTMMVLIGEHFFTMGVHAHVAGTMDDVVGNKYGDVWVRAMLGMGL